MARTELREIAIQMILTEVHKGYTIDEAVGRITARPRSTSIATAADIHAGFLLTQRSANTEIR